MDRNKNAHHFTVITYIEKKNQQEVVYLNLSSFGHGLSKPPIVAKQAEQIKYKHNISSIRIKDMPFWYTKKGNDF